MKGLPFVLAFTAMTFVAWGAYGPLLHHGTASMGRDSLRAFVGVGIAYFIIAVIVPIFILRTQGETGKWTISGTFYSLIAGAVGAFGALGVILALAYGGAPIYVMPLVFGFAPIVNTLVTAWMSKTFDQISLVFIGGIVVAALGVAGVLAFKPPAPAHAAHSKEDSKKIESHETAPKSKDSSDARSTNRMRFVKTQTQEPIGEQLPPVVVQPAGLSSESAKASAAAAPASEQAAAPESTVQESANPQAAGSDQKPTTAAQQELPPVVVQPAPPSDKQPAEPEPTAPATESAQPTQPVDQVKPTEVKPAEPNAAVTTPSVAPADVTPTAPNPAVPASTAPEQPSPTPSATEVKTADTVARPKATQVPVDDGKLEDVNVPAKQQATTVNESGTAKAPAPKADVPMIILSIVVAAICWGSYGPMLHQGQARMSGSRLRPFTCVGLAYFIIAVAAPLAVIAARTADTGAWSVGGLTWSIIAGAAGAIGAVGVILAFNAGGKPYYVMPLVFGFAPVINTCISLTENGLWGLVRPEFWVSLAVVIAGAITVLITAPKPQHGKPHGAPSPAPSR